MTTSLKNGQLGSKESAESCARAVMDTVPLLARYIGAEMRRSGNLQVSMPQLKVLAFISRNPGTSLTSAAEDLAVTAATASNLVDRLVKRGYVKREEDPNERRKVLLSLTESGTVHLELCRQFAQASVATLIADLPQSKLLKLNEGLNILKEAFDEEPRK
jgi:DNA-binding MarR family transcriptional regulator